jgi:4-amino-4-deoxy-L-arabinose transferase-like glycosyltransferase
MTKKGWTLLLLVLIIVLAGFLRFYRLGDLLPLFGDEVDTGYNAYSLLKTGKDVTGHFLPVYLQTFIDSKSSLLAYLTTLPVLFGGLNGLTVRAIPAFSGTLLVVLVFLLTRKIFQEEKVALLAAFLSATSPWLIHFSRGGFEAMLMVLLLLGAILSFFELLKEKSKPSGLYLFFFVLCLALSLYAYHAAKVLVPFLVIGLIFFFRKKVAFSPKIKITAGLFFLLLIMPILWSSLSGEGQRRFTEVSLFKDQTIIDRVILKRGEEPSFLVGRLFHNKGESFGQKALENYLESFSPQFLFLYGDPNFRHRVGWGGETLWICFPFWLLGLYYLLQKKEPEARFLFYWLLVAPFPAVITKDGGQHAIRLLFMAPAMLIITAYGFWRVWQKLEQKKRFGFLLFGFLCMFLFLANFSLFFHQYLVHYPRESWRYWAYGYKEAMTFLRSEEKNYDQIFINNSYEPSILWFLFWTQYDPRKLKLEPVPAEKFKKVNVETLGRYSFYKPTEIDWKYGGVFQFLTKPRHLVMAAAKNDTAGDKDLREFPLKGVKLVKTITDPQDNPIFYFLKSDMLESE